jgi:hypothetical protein
MFIGSFAQSCELMPLCSLRLLGARSGAGLRKNQQSSSSTSYVGRWLRLRDPKEQFYTKQDNFEHPLIWRS